MSLTDNEGFTQIALGTEGAERAFQNVEPQKHGLFVQFFMHPRQNSAKTLEMGRPIYDETEYVRIMVPGDKSSIVERPIRLGASPAFDNFKFAKEYELFKANKNQQVTGTPLKQWPVMSRSQVLELEFFNVRTVEQLADISDTHMQKFAGLGKLRELARRFMQHAEGAAPLSQMQASLDESKNTIETQNEQIKAITVELASMRAQINASGGTAPVATTIVQAASPAAASAPSNAAAPIEENDEADALYASAPLDLNAENEQKAPEEKAEAPKKTAAKSKKARRAIAT